MGNVLLVTPFLGMATLRGKHGVSHGQRGHTGKQVTSRHDRYYRGMRAADLRHWDGHPRVWTGPEPRWPTAGECSGRAHPNQREPNRRYDSGYKWWGIYEWSYRGSSGHYEASKGYESEIDVPKHHTVRIYLGQDDAWHTVDRREAGGLLVGGVALVACGIAGAILGILMRKRGIGL